MRLWSKGLGKLILPLDMGMTETSITPEHAIFSGTIRDGKIIWDYTIKMEPDDLTGFTGLVLRKDVMDYLARHNGMGLLVTILKKSVGFFMGMVKTAFGRGTSVVKEETLGLGPKKRHSRAPGKKLV